MTKKPTYEELEHRLNQLTADCTRYKKVEGELNRSLQFTESLLAAIPTPIFFKDAQGRYQGCNPAFSEIMGKTTQELRGKTVHELWPSEHAEVYHQKDLELMQHPIDQVYEFEIKDKNGTIRPVIFYKSVFQDERGKVAGLVGGFVDITERKRMEEALRESEEQHRSIIQKIQAAVVIHDADTQIIACNSKAEELMGLTENQMMGKAAVDPDWQFIKANGQRLPLEEYPVNQVLTSRQPLKEMTAGIFCPDKADVVWVLANAEPVFDHRGDIHQVFVTFMDITQRKTAEEALKKSENRYRAISELTSDYAYAYRVEPDGGLINEWVTGAFERLTGFTKEEVIARGGWESLINPEDMPIPLEQLKALLSNRSQTVEYRIFDKAGKIRWMRDSAKPIWNEKEDRLEKILGAVQEFTEQEEAERELSRYREQLEELVRERTSALEAAQNELMKKERLAVLGQLTATVSHELRNPLGVIRSSSFYLQQRCKGQNERVKKHINRIEDQVEICDSIVGDLLEYTRGRHSQMVKGEINPWIEQILDEISEAEEMKIEKFLADSLPKVHFDKEKMRRVMVNLINNALQAITEQALKENSNSYRPAITVSSVCKDGNLLITIKDNGIGMDKETIERAFEPLFTTRARGTGLGLANVEKIIEEHNGTILLESKPHKGTTVIITIPVMVQ